MQTTRTLGELRAIALAAAAVPAPSSGGELDPEPPQAEPAPAVYEVVVTATRSARPLRDVPAAVTVLPRAEIERSPAKTADELLRIVPSFGLFRRSSSGAADPSSQGVNLRGAGPSAVSRSLVLVDGIPANDAFGGWVYWRAIPRIGIQSIEVVPGGGSALYGNCALGGVTQFISRRISSLAVDAAEEAGSFGTFTARGRASKQWGPLGAVAEGEWFTSSGYPVVAPYARGPIDGDTPSDHASGSARVEVQATPELTLALRGGYFREDQNGGTRYTTAGVRRLEYGAGARWAAGAAGAFDLEVFGHAGEFTQERAAVDANRTAESLASTQDVPTHDLGAGLLWTSRPLPLAGTHTLTLGSDVRRVTGDTREHFLTSPTLAQRNAEGEQRLYGAFAQDLYDVSEALAVSVAIRYDRWDDLNASRYELSTGGTSTLVEFPHRGQRAWSPKVGLRLRPLDWLTLRAGAYGAFRAPTLNELYRPFQVGTVLTLSNESLRAETLKGAEAGVEVFAPLGFTARATGFWNDLDDPVVNVTVGTNLRQRENLGQARIRGLEAEVGWRFARTWLFTVAWTFADAVVTEAPGIPALVGKDLPQDPKNRAAASLVFDDQSILTAAVQLRYMGRQYEDDLNTLPMAAAAVVDVAVSWHLGRYAELVLAVENLFDKTYLVGRSGVDTVGQPRFLHGGVRLRAGE